MTYRKTASQEKPKKEKLESIWSASYVALLCVNFFQSMGAQLASTIMPLAARDMGADATMVGVVVGAFGVTALLIRPFSGPAFDSFSKKRLYFASYFLNAISMFLYVLASTPEALILVRLLHGIGIGCAAPLGMALVSKVVPVSRISSGVSIYTLAFSIAQAIGPAFAVWMAGTYGYSVTFILAGIMLSIACCIVPLVKVKPDTNRPPYKIKLDRIFAKQAIIPSAILLLVAGSFSCTGSFIVIYGKMLGVSDIGFYFTVYAVCMLVTRPVFGRLSDTYGPKNILLFAFVMFAISYAIVSQATTLPVFLLAAAIGSCGYALCNPLIQALAMRMVPEDRTGACTNTTYTGLDTGFFVGPIVAGMLIDVYIPIAGTESVAYSWMWLTMLIPIALAAILLITQYKRIEGNVKTASATNSK